MADQVLQAVNTLFHGDPGVRKEADRWLEHWQQTPEAWSVADSVLHNANSSMEAQHFCAQTLKTKVTMRARRSMRRDAARQAPQPPPANRVSQVQRDFDELPSDAVAQLRESLLSLIVKFSRGAPPVRG